MSKRLLIWTLLGLVVLTSLTTYFFIRPKESTPARSSSHKTVCLNMIVKNERDVITRCLASVLPLIDYWVIIDTGSTDGTQTTIKEFMREKGVPGELHERPWKDFAYNRNEAMQLAKGKSDYIFLIDADEYLVFDSDFTLPHLDKDYYYMYLTHFGTKWSKIQLINNHQDWAFTGVLHEVIAAPSSRSVGRLDKVVNIYTSDGFRSKDPLKYQKDAKVLEAALQQEPNNSRYTFYLAQSYSYSNNPLKAIEAYEKRIKMGGANDPEIFLSLVDIALLQERLDMPKDTIVRSYKRAMAYNIARAEPYYLLANYYRRIGDFNSGYHVAKIGLTIPLYKDVLWVQEWMYNYGMLLEYSVCAYWIEHYQECQVASLSLLEKDLPPNVRECVQNNLGFANQKLVEQISAAHTSQK